MSLKFLPLVWANLQRRRLRSLLTVASITVAFLLFSLMLALQNALVGGVELAGQDRLITTHKTSIIQTLPQSYLTRVSALENVRIACAINWFGGYFKDERNQVFTYSVLNEDAFFDVYPELLLTEAEKQAWLQDRRGVLVGKSVAQRLGWKVGDTVPLRSGIFFQADGSNTWTVNIKGIYSFKNDVGDTSGVYMHYDYFNEGRISHRNSVGWIILRVKDATQITATAKQIDALFTNSSTETKTATEKAFMQGFANQIGNIGSIITLIVSAVFFTILLVTANTMSQSVRERTNEIAVMKTLGFSSNSVTVLIFVEALLMTALGGITGLMLGRLAVKTMGTALQQYFPFMNIPNKAYLMAVACMLLLAVLAGALPCAQAWQLKINDALRRA